MGRQQSFHGWSAADNAYQSLNGPFPVIGEAAIVAEI
jgi:hypothetical protein